MNPSEWQLTGSENRSQEPSQVDDAQAAPPVHTNPDIPAEIAELRDLLATAESNRDAADAAAVAALAELNAAHRNLNAARNQVDVAEQAEVDARASYVAALRRHGYVQTADGPKPATDEGARRVADNF